MKLKTIIVSVEYLDFFAFSYNVNKHLIEDIIVITSNDDYLTQNFCKQHNISFHITDAFYSISSRIGNEDAYFNKAAAINDYLYSLPSLDELEWILFLDSDILLNRDIITRIFSNEEQISPMNLYGAKRNTYKTIIDFQNNSYDKHDECDYIGFFQLFHKNIILDDYNNRQSILCENIDASQSDLEFRDRYFSITNRHCFGSVDHLGESGINWRGRVCDLWE